MAPAPPPDLADHLALALVPGLGPRLTAALLQHFGTAHAARRATESQLRSVPQIGDKLAASFAHALETLDPAAEFALLDRFGVRPVLKGHAGYPPPLAPLPAAPPLLYCRGEWLPADDQSIGIVGSRQCTPYGKRMAAELAAGFARAGWTVVSGLARGIDGAAHRGALEAGGRTVAVLAGGLSRIYPPEHADLAEQIVGCGALLTETPMTVAPQPGMFPARNRIISGVSRAVVVVEANLKSGALITVTHALEQGREVFAVPGNVDSPASAGCLELIRKGAKLVRSAADVLEDLNGVSARVGPAPTLFDALPPAAVVVPPPAAPVALEPGLKAVYDALAGPRHGDDLARESGLSVGELSMVLMKLEMKKLVRRLPGNQYERR